MVSLKWRLITVATIWIAIGFVAAGFVFSAIFRHEVTAQFYEELYVHLDELQRLAQFASGGRPHLQRDLSDPRYDVPLSGYYWEIQQADNVLARSSSLKGHTLPTPPDEPIDTGIHTHKITGPTGPLLVAERTRTGIPGAPPVRFIIGTDQRHLDAVLDDFNSVLAWALAGFGLSLVAAAALLIAFALRPFRQLRSALSRVRSGETNQLHGEFPSEVRPLVADLNRLLQAAADTIQRARTQAGNLAHGLKTPLAILTDEGYRLADAGAAEASRTILSQCSKMQSQINYQVTRARAVAMRASPGIVADVRSAADDVASALGRLYQPANIAIQTDVKEGLKVACDPQDLNEMIANLVDNACKHARAKVRLSVADTPANNRLLSINIDDDGPGLPPEARRVVFNIGERWDTHAPGTGLGLTIVKDLAELYGGEVELGTSSMGGLSVALRLPRAGL
ncbi:MAG TPA: HAMP domain-containing sensor histidine kinase [Hyphomicrobium sp.]|nr:HAMP domain-containing sensor histidine kinase [Hyphomicrobium sp.]